MDTETRLGNLAREVMLEVMVEHNGVKSLTKDLVFFFTFVFQVVILFVFFWQKRQNVRRYVLGESTEIDDSEDAQTGNPPPRETNSTATSDVTVTATRQSDNLAASTMVEKTPEQALDEEFVPIETALNELNAKIRGLEGTLRRRAGRNNTDSLKRRLRDAISHITVTLAQMSKIQQATIHNDRVAQLAAEKQELEQKKKALEEVESDDVGAKQPTAIIPPSQEAPMEKEPVATEPVKAQEPPATPEPVDSKPGEPVAPEKPAESTTNVEADEERALEAAMEEQMAMFSKKGGRIDQRKIGKKAAGLGAMFVSTPEPEEPKASPAEEPVRPPATAIPAGPAPSTASLLDLFNAKPTKEEEPAKSSLAELAAQLGAASEPRVSEPLVSSTDDLMAMLEHVSPRPSSSDYKPAADAEDDSDNDSDSDDSDDEDSDSEEVQAPADSTADLLASLNALSGDKSGTKADVSSDDLLASLGQQAAETTDAKGDTDDLLKSLEAFAPPKSEGTTNNASDLLAALEDLGSPKAEEESDSDSDSGSDSDSDDEDDDEKSGPAGLLKSFGTAADINTSGLKRAKKVKLGKGVSGEAQYQMEDVYITVRPYLDSDDNALFCIFDGHAGKECATEAGKVFPDILAKRMAELPANAEDVSAALSQAFLETDKALLAYEDEGTTATAVLLRKLGEDRFLQAANVGDSTAVLIYSDGSARVLTVDHRPTHPIEVERLKSVGIFLNPGQNRLNGLAVSRALGDHFPKQEECGIIADPAVSEVVKLKDEVLLIVASDGLWDVVAPDQAWGIVKEEMGKDEPDPRRMANFLLRTATKSAKCTDNVSVIVVAL